LSVFSADREGKTLATVDVGGPIAGTPTAANGVLYISTASRLYALANPAH
jgi:hypothetical protein